MDEPTTVDVPCIGDTVDEKVLYFIVYINCLLVYLEKE